MLPPIPFARSALLNLRASLPRTAFAASPARHARSFASVLPNVPATTPQASSSNSQLPGGAADARKKGAKRPHLGVEVNPKHGLYGFFRKKVEDGVTKYVTMEVRDVTTDSSGRAWTAPELRRKCFKDLHTLWYVLLRERNLLATQREEARRTGVRDEAYGAATKVFRVRKSMARIKYVINERRLAYEGALQIFKDRVKGRQVRSQLERQRRRQVQAENIEKKQLALKTVQPAVAAVAGKTLNEHDVAHTAAAGLFA